MGEPVPPVEGPAAEGAGAAPASAALRAAAEPPICVGLGRYEATVEGVAEGRTGQAGEVAEAHHCGGWLGTRELQTGTPPGGHGTPQIPPHCGTWGEAGAGAPCGARASPARGQRQVGQEERAVPGSIRRCPGRVGGTPEQKERDFRGSQEAVRRTHHNFFRTRGRSSMRRRRLWSNTAKCRASGCS